MHCDFLDCKSRNFS